MPRKEQGWITFQSSPEERKILEQYCKQCQRSKTEILRELVRGLSQPSSPPTEPFIQPQERDTLEISPEPPSERSAIRVSARNVLRGTVRRVVTGDVNAEVTLEIAPGVTLTSIITSASAEQLELSEGKQVYAIIKSSNVMIGHGA
jgi:molybdopterin-binding protein